MTGPIGIFGGVTNALIVFGYCTVCWMLFHEGAKARHSAIKRAKYALLGLALMSFGLGRFLWAFGILERWMFTLGHFSLLSFGFLYFYASKGRANGPS